MKPKGRDPDANQRLLGATSVTVFNLGLGLMHRLTGPQ